MRAARLRLGLVAASFLALAGILSPGLAGPAAAASPAKVVIVVGATGAATSSYISNANAAAAVARRYTSNVVTIYSPYATWAAVSRAMQGANIVLYLGHGNGFPSPYSSTLNVNSMDGMGLNATAGAGNSNTRYYGESYIAYYIRLAPNAVVLMNRLCYASGNSEWGAGTPTLTVAKQRVDNFAAGFIAAGARAVIADGLGDISWYISALFTRHSTIDSLFRAAPNAHRNFLAYASSRSRGFTSLMDIGTYSYVPDHDPYYRSMVSIPSLPTDSVVGSVASPLTGRTTYSGVNVRSGAGTGYGIVASLASGTAFSVTGAIRIDASGRTWAPIRLSSGKSGWVATVYASFSGRAVAMAPLNLRSSASTSGSVVAVLKQGTVLTVTGSVARGAATWFSVRTASGATGWVASWFTGP